MPCRLRPAGRPDAAGRSLSTRSLQGFVPKARAGRTAAGRPSDHLGWGDRRRFAQNDHRDRPRRDGGGDDPGGGEDLPRRQGRRPLRHRCRRARGRGRVARLVAAGDHRLPGRPAQAPHRGRRRAGGCLARLRDGRAGSCRLGRALCLGPAARLVVGAPPSSERDCSACLDGHAADRRRDAGRRGLR